MDALLEIDAALYLSSMQSYRQSIDVCSESIDTLNIAKTLSFLLPGFRAAVPPSKSSKTLLPLRDAVIACCLPFAATPQAALRSSFRQRAITVVCSEVLALRQR
jgi:hypothetical protein